MQPAVTTQSVFSGPWAGHAPGQTCRLSCLGVPFAIYLLAMLWLVGMHGDLRVADHLYAWEGNAWTLRSNFLVEELLHVVGKRISALAWVLVALAWLFARARGGAWRRPLGRLALSVMLATALVALTKSWTGVHCAWELQRYGGNQAYLTLFDAIAAGAGRSGCFPAGHASAGYAWIALYFFFAETRPRWRWTGLAIGLAAGIAFGLAQQLRGAHLLSHDMTSLMICWAVAVLAFRLLPPRAGAGT